LQRPEFAHNCHPVFHFLHFSRAN
jgi:hypothetical protein